MLILTRKVGESVIIGEDVKLTVLNAKGNQIRLGINAPKSVSVHREEIFNRIQEGDTKTVSPMDEQEFIHAVQKLTTA